MTKPFIKSNDYGFGYWNTTIGPCDGCHMDFAGYIYYFHHAIRLVGMRENLFLKIKLLCISFKVSISTFRAPLHNL